MNFVELQERMRETPLSTGGGESTTWHTHRKNLREHVLNATRGDDFLLWSTIQATMFVGNAHQARLAHDKVVGINRYQKVLADPGFGKPTMFRSGTSGNFCVQVSHLSMWEEHTGKHVEDLNTIQEFGGGYGSLCYIVNRLGFKGQYTLVDLPEFLLLQEYYLSNTLPDGNIAYKTMDKSPAYADLFIANLSMSEVPIDTRDAYFSPHYFEHWLICFQVKFGDLDNWKYFGDLGDLYGCDIVDSPTFKNHVYMLGNKNE